MVDTSCAVALVLTGSPHLLAGGDGARLRRQVGLVRQLHPAPCGLPVQRSVQAHHHPAGACLVAAACRCRSFLPRSRCQHAGPAARQPLPHDLRRGGGVGWRPRRSQICRRQLRPLRSNTHEAALARHALMPLEKEPRRPKRSAFLIPGPSAARTSFPYENSGQLRALLPLLPDSLSDRRSGSLLHKWYIWCGAKWSGVCRYRGTCRYLREVHKVRRRGRSRWGHTRGYVKWGEGPTQVGPHAGWSAG